MSTALLAVFAVILCILFRILNVNSAPRKPVIVCNDESFLTNILKITPVLRDPYKPTRLWGFSGHVQTIIHSIIGRVRCPWPIGERVYITLSDGTTLTYDLYQPLNKDHQAQWYLFSCFGKLGDNYHHSLYGYRDQISKDSFIWGYQPAVHVLDTLDPVSIYHHSEDRLAPYIYSSLNLWDYLDDITIAICPGIGNSSESVYIRTFVHFSQCHGYRCAVLNHVGALSSVKVTAPRIFTYGHTEDYHVMLESLMEKHTSTQIVCVGFSLGGNLVTKYMGEKGSNKMSSIIGAISICQGYNAIEGTKFLLNWQNFRRFYLYVMTESVKNIILRHKSVLLADNVKQRHGLNERDIISAATLPELDEAYTRKIHNFRTVKDMYKWSSCINYLTNIYTPMVFINALDDPIVPEQLLIPIKDFASKHSNTLYIELAHGGHLGFYEGGLLYPNPITWLDRTLVSLVGSLALAHADRALKMS